MTIPASCGCKVDERGFCFRCGKCSTRNAGGHCLCAPYKGATGLQVDRQIKRERVAAGDRRTPAQADADERWNQKLERESDDAGQW